MALDLMEELYAFLDRVDDNPATEFGIAAKLDGIRYTSEKLTGYAYITVDFSNEKDYPMVDSIYMHILPVTQMAILQWCVVHNVKFTFEEHSP